MNDVEFWSVDHRYGLRVPGAAICRILTLCTASHPYETGGILIGYYSEGLDCAIVTHVAGPPADSRRGLQWFRRGVRGLQGQLDLLWVGMRRYYLGEWHYHPSAPADLSPTDHQQMTTIARSVEYKCPEPILFIVGGEANRDWVYAAYLFPRGEACVEMLR